MIDVSQDECGIQTIQTFFSLSNEKRKKSGLATQDYILTTHCPLIPTVLIWSSETIGGKSFENHLPNLSKYFFTDKVFTARYQRLQHNPLYVHLSLWWLYVHTSLYIISYWLCWRSISFLMSSIITFCWSSICCVLYD